MKEEMEKRLAEIRERINRRAMELLLNDPQSCVLMGARDELLVWLKRMGGDDE